MDIPQTLAFTFAAVALLGSPGPGIAALVAVGRACPVGRALTFYASMQVGLAIAAGLSAAGLASLLHGAPAIEIGVTILATLYLIWLAWSIASAPVEQGAIDTVDSRGLTNKGAFFLGIANPKAYLAFASLFGSFVLLPHSTEPIDGAVKWVICVTVMVLVDLAWLAVGMALGQIGLTGRKARWLNIFMGVTILLACVISWR